MAEVKEEVKTFTISYNCEVCEKGKLIFVGWENSPNWVEEVKVPIYRHKCNNEQCGHEEILKVQYPYLAYERIPIRNSVDLSSIIGEVLQPIDLLLGSSSKYITESGKIVSLTGYDSSSWDVSVFTFDNGGKYLRDGKEVIDYHPTEERKPDNLVKKVE